MRLKIFNLISSIILLGIAFHVFANDKQPFAKYIFVSSSKGGRCHSAINSFLNKNAFKDEKIFFCKSSKEAIQKAEKQQGAVFLKLVSLPDFHIHNDAVLAFKEYKIAKVYALVKHKTKYCLLRHKKALTNKVQLSSVASSPYTLQLHRKWIRSNHLLEVEVPAGSSEAARLLSDGILNLNTGVITSIHASTVYDNLKAVKSDLGANTTYDIFALVEVKKRDKAKNASDVEQEISQIFNRHTTLKEDNTTNDVTVFLEDSDSRLHSLERSLPDLL